MVNLHNTLQVIVMVNYGEFLQHTLGNFDGNCGEFYRGIRSGKIGR